MQYYRLQQIHSGAIDLKVGQNRAVYSPADVGTGKAKDEKLPLSEIVKALNERFGTSFSEKDRLFFQQLMEKAASNQKIVNTALANPLDKFELGIGKLLEDLMIECMSENDGIVTRYMSDRDFHSVTLSLLARGIFETVRHRNL